MTTIRAAANTELPMTLQAAADERQAGGVPAPMTSRQRPRRVVPPTKRIDETAQLKVASATPCPRPRFGSESNGASEVFRKLQWTDNFSTPDVFQTKHSSYLRLLESAKTFHSNQLGHGFEMDGMDMFNCRRKLASQWVSSHPQGATISSWDLLGVNCL